MSETLANAVVELSVSGMANVQAGVGQVKGLLGNLGITPATLGIVGVGGAIAYAIKKAMDWEAKNEELRASSRRWARMPIRHPPR